MSDVPTHDIVDPQPRAGVWSLPPVWYFAAFIALLVALAASGALVVQHIAGITLPGCSASSQTGGFSLTGEEPAQPACATLEAHPLGSLGGMVYGIKALAANQPVGKVPVEHAWWPISFVGAAYFAGALAGWVCIGVQRRQLTSPVRKVVWFGALATVGYLVIIILEKKYCQYCITSHIANLGFLAVMEIGIASGLAQQRRSVS